jgi:hypothetical protein
MRNHHGDGVLVKRNFSGEFCYIDSEYVRAAEVEILGNPKLGMGDSSRMYVFERKTE